LNVKRSGIIPLTILMVLSAALLTVKVEAATSPKGVDVYTCDCEEGCPCPSPYLEPGKCECGLELAKMRVLKIAEGKAYLCKCDDATCPCQFDAKDPKKCGCGTPVKEINTKGKYVCACGPDCRCNTISPVPGKCSCGVQMKKVE
jgi:hypothetical protein